MMVSDFTFKEKITLTHYFLEDRLFYQIQAVSTPAAPFIPVCERRWVAGLAEQMFQTSEILPEFHYGETE